MTTPRSTDRASRDEAIGYPHGSVLTRPIDGGIREHFAQQSVDDGEDGFSVSGSAGPVAEMMKAELGFDFRPAYLVEPPKARQHRLCTWRVCVPPLMRVAGVSGAGPSAVFLMLAVHVRLFVCPLLLPALPLSPPPLIPLCSALVCVWLWPVAELHPEDVRLAECFEHARFAYRRQWQFLPIETSFATRPSFGAVSPYYGSTKRGVTAGTCARGWFVVASVGDDVVAGGFVVKLPSPLLLRFARVQR